MGEDLRRRGLAWRWRRRLWRRAQPGQCRADHGLAKAEAAPEALPGAVAEMAIGGPDGSGHGTGGGEQEEAAKAGGGQTQSADFVGDPDAESAAAPRPCLAIAAKDASGADGFVLEVLLVESVQTAVAIENADDLAMRTRRMLEPLSHCRPFVVAAAKPALLCHASHASTKIVILQAWKSGGVEAGYD